MAENMAITIAEAVRARYASKPRLYRAIKDGRLTAGQNAAGTKTIDVADLVRLFGEPAERPSVAAKVRTDGAIDVLQAENGRLRAELASAREDARTARAQGAEERERLYQILETNQKLITDMTEGRRAGFWARLFA